MKNLKILLLGDSNVGKSTFLTKYISGYFSKTFELTVGVDYGSKIITHDNEQIKLHIWDTAGQETFRAITRSYYRNTKGVLLFFDLTNIDSFNNIKYWIQSYLEIENNSSIVIIGNKYDKNRVVKKSDCLELANELNVTYIELSLKNDTIEKLELIMSTLIKNMQISEIEDTDHLSINQSQKNNCGLDGCVII